MSGGTISLNESRDLQLPGFRLTATGVVIEGNPELGEWKAAMQFVSRTGGSSMWWLGDLLAIGDAKYGELASQDVGDGRYEQKTLYQAKWVAENVQFSMRIENLSFTHHSLVAGMSPAEQNEWLEKADKEKLSAAKLRTHIQESKRLADREESADFIRPQIEHTSWDLWLPNQPQCDLLLTDPPYSTDIPDIEKFAQAWLPSALAKVKSTGRAFVCIGGYAKEIAAYSNVDHCGMVLADTLVWTYRNTLGPTPKLGYKQNWQAILHFRGPDAPALNCESMIEQFSVIDIPAPDGRHGNRLHAWQKPVELGERFVRHSTKPGDIVLDPFAGTGTFLITAASLGRKAFGCDSDLKMLKVAVGRGCEEYQSVQESDYQENENEMFLPKKELMATV